MLKVDVNGRLVEIPITSLQLPFLGNFPIVDGIYMKFLPYDILRFEIKKLNDLGLSAVFYIHPKDLDQNTPVSQAMHGITIGGSEAPLKNLSLF